MKNILLFSMLFALTTFGVRAQGKTNDDDFLYKKQITYGVNVHTNGGLLGGFAVRYARAITPTRFRHFSFELVNIKHHKEIRAQSVAGQSFIPGKQNYLYFFRPLYGREIILFKRASEQGVQVNFIGAAGPNLSIIVPYIIQYNITPKSCPNCDHVLVNEQYDPNRHVSFDQVVKSMGLSQGLSKSKFTFGASAKAALSFEFSSFKNTITGFEAGVVADALIDKPILMPLGHNRRIFTGAYITLFYGSRD